MLRFIPPILPFVIFKNKNLLCDEYLQIPRKIKIRTIEISATSRDILPVNSRNISCHGITRRPYSPRSEREEGRRGR